MSARIELNRVRIHTGSPDSTGCLAFVDGDLIGVLTYLEPDLHEEAGLARHWFLEVGFGRVGRGPKPPAFSTLDDARTWLAGHFEAPGPVLGAG
ncbi:hypothetical protein OPKNFCMD_4685 [Methylobacterium crusticola]|uniref:GNAT family N-acetyltransferase n=1 Tax=Methylobacterium crusticola TaxID=1697972 RepID=A0ABQ4R3R9_9HYPH|nr:hypothetical protein [Methylobacterium crusticola]GJD51926.1 hypothetical protein OPKNFCMD_4685 [Methylobacterium crusticola]